MHPRQFIQISVIISPSLLKFSSFKHVWHFCHHCLDETLRKTITLPLFWWFKVSRKVGAFHFKTWQEYVSYETSPKLSTNEYIIISMNMTSFCCYKLFKFLIQIWTFGYKITLKGRNQIRLMVSTVYRSCLSI